MTEFFPDELFQNLATGGVAGVVVVAVLKLIDRILVARQTDRDQVSAGMNALVDRLEERLAAAEKQAALAMSEVALCRQQHAEATSLATILRWRLEDLERRVSIVKTTEVPPTT